MLSLSTYCSLPVSLLRAGDGSLVASLLPMWCYPSPWNVTRPMGVLPILLVDLSAASCRLCELLRLLALLKTLRLPSLLHLAYRERTAMQLALALSSHPLHVLCSTLECRHPRMHRWGS